MFCGSKTLSFDLGGGMVSYRGWEFELLAICVVSLTIVNSTLNDCWITINLIPGRKAPPLLMIIGSTREWYKDTFWWLHDCLWPWFVDKFSSFATTEFAWSTNLMLHCRSRLLAVGRVQVISGRRHVNILSVESVGHYAIRFVLLDLFEHEVIKLPLLSTFVFELGSIYVLPGSLPFTLIQGVGNMRVSSQNQVRWSAWDWNIYLELPARVGPQ